MCVDDSVSCVKNGLRVEGPSTEELGRMFRRGAVAEFLGAGRIISKDDLVKSSETLERIRRWVELAIFDAGVIDWPRDFRGVRRCFKSEKKQANKIVRILLGFTWEEFERVMICYPGHTFHPYVQVFIEGLVKFKMKQVFSSFNNFGISQKIRARIKGVLRYVKRVVKGKEMKKIISRHRRGANKNAKSAWEYVKKLYLARSKLMVVWVDFHYREEFSHGHNKISFEKAISHRVRFLRSMKYREEFQHLIGMMWKIEYTYIKGFHMHVLFFFDGQKREDSVYACKEIDGLWREITQGMGYTFGINEANCKHAFPCVGVIQHDNLVGLRGLKYAVCYLTKVDFFAKLNIPGRTFGKMVPPRVSNKGRPRSLESMADSV